MENFISKLLSTNNENWEETQEDFRNTIYEMRETVLDLVWIDFVKACH